MIPVARPVEPTYFDEKCRKPGQSWLMANPGPDVSPHQYPLWKECLDDLRAAFENRCGFLAMYIPRGTVDHWISIHTDRSKAYEWGNYRFVDGAVNSAKKPGWEGKLLDPFEVGDDWFEIHLPSLQMTVAHIGDPEARERAEFTLNKLGLRDREDVLRLRREWMAMYETGELSLEGLRRVAPLLARAVEKQRQTAAPSPGS